MLLHQPVPVGVEVQSQNNGKAQTSKLVVEELSQNGRDIVGAT